MFEAELIFGGLVVLWIAYEVFGRNAIEIIQSYMVYIRIAGGIAVIGFLYWHVTKNPENLQDTLGFAKHLMLPSATGRYTSTEKRSVTNLMKKKVAADQQWKCGGCGETLDESYEVDHKLALYKGGSNDAANLVALCRNCHGKKTMAERLESP